MQQFLPQLYEWAIHPDKAPPHFDYSHWMTVLGFATLLSLVVGGIQSNLPLRPSELLKSLVFGFALNAAKFLTPR